MFTISKTGFMAPFFGGYRVVSKDKLTIDDFTAIADQIGQTPSHARKAALIAARQSQDEQLVVTHWKGEETRNTAHVGDWIVTSLQRNGEPMRDDGQLNQYVITADKFAELYGLLDGDPALSSYGAIYLSRKGNEVEALFFKGGFDIMAPWGERQSGACGYLLKNGDDIYGNEKETFEETYEILD